MKDPLENLTIGSFAKAAGVNVETIRFYQRRGLLPEPNKPYGSIRRYGAKDLARVKFVKSAQRLGFKLEEIALLLALGDGMHCDAARTLAERKLGDVRSRLRDLKRIEEALAELVVKCRATSGPISCPVIARLYSDDPDGCGARER
jgi:MerR family mercuric resistance operon transcriptional regulator